MLTLQIFVLAIFFVQDILCLRKMYCDTNDEECITNAVNERVFPKLIAGGPGVEPLDPLHLTTLEVNLPNLKLNLLNATVTGVKDCVINYKKNTSDLVFEYQSCCPLLTLQSEYEADGKIDAVSVKGKGTFKITYEQYNINVVGNQIKVEYGDCKQHIRILDYTIQLDLKGKSAYEYDNLLFGSSGKCKCNAALRSRYFDRFEEITRTPIMKAFINKFMESLRDFYTAVPVEELYYKYV